MKNIILYINTTGEEKVYLALGNKGKLIAKKEFKAKYRQSERLIPAIDLLLKKNKVKMQDLSGIAVVNGPGPFTATRIGVTVANALGYACGLQVAGIKNSEFKNQEKLIKLGYEKLRKVKKSYLVEPVYDKEPNITVSKK